MPKFMDVIQYEEIDHPSHYNPNGIEAISVIEDWNLGFCLGSVIKYICRHNRKTPLNPLNDLLKARWYLDRYIEKVRTCLETKSPTSTSTQVQETKEAEKEPKLNVADIEFMLTTINDIEQLVLKQVTGGPVGRTSISELRADRIAKVTFRAFKEAFRTEVKDQLRENTNAT